MTNQDLSTAASLAMHAVADLPHKANESVLYPTIAEDDAEAVRRCVPWLREHGRRVHIMDIGKHNVHALAYQADADDYADECLGRSIAECLCKLCIAVAESEAKP